MRNATTRSAAAVAAWLLFPIAFGCGGDPAAGGDPGGDEGLDFRLQLLDSDAVTIQAGSDAPVHLVVRVDPGKPRPSVFLRVEGLPEGVSAQAEHISSNDPHGFVWLSARPEAPEVRDVPVRIVGTSLAGLEREVTVRVSVVPGNPADDPCDTTFGPIMGVATAKVGDQPVLGDVAVLSDGSVLAVGHAAGEEVGFLARWDGSGWPVSDFGLAGVRQFRNFWPERLLPLPGGLALVAGQFFADYEPGRPGPSAPALALLAGTDFDREFGTYGVVVLAPVYGDVLALARFGTEAAVSIATPHGHLLVRVDLGDLEILPPVLAGPAPVASAFAPDGSVVAVSDAHAFQFLADGGWDRDFGSGGHLSLGGALLGAVLPTGNDGFLVGGAVAETGTATKAFVTRVTGDGRIDPSFPDNLRWRFEAGGVPQVIDLVALPGGVAALAYEHPSRILDLVRFDWTGRVHEQYGDGGILRIPYLARYPSAALAADDRGNVLVAYVASPDGIAVNRCLAE